MSDFTFIGKKIACEPYLFRGEITASNKLTVVSSSNFLGSITASTISASKIIGYIDSASYSLYAVTASYAMNGGGASLVTGSTYPITSSWALNSVSASTALSSAFAYSSSYALTASYALNAASGGGGNIFVATSSIIDINFSSSVDKFVTNGVLSNYTLTFSANDPTQLLVFLDGLEQEPTTDYTVSGTTLSLTSVPPSSLELEVRRFYSSATINILTSSLNAQYFIGDGGTTQYNLSQSVSQDYDILVTINGLVKKPSLDYTTTGSILNFTSAPSSGSEGQFRYLLTSTTGLLFSGSLITGSTYEITSSYAISSSYALTASYAMNGGGSSLTTGSSYPITSSWSLNSDTSSYLNPLNQIVILTKVSSSLQFIDDAAAAAGGVPLGGLYRNGNFILIRLN